MLELSGDRGSGKTFALAAIAFANVLQGNSVVITAPNIRRAKHVFDSLVDMVTKSHGLACVISDTDLHINGVSASYYGPDSPYLYSDDEVLIIDEVQDFPLNVLAKINKLGRLVFCSDGTYVVHSNDANRYETTSFRVCEKH